LIIDNEEGIPHESLENLNELLDNDLLKINFAAVCSFIY